MFCNRCGMEMPSEHAACPKCGRRIGDVVSGVAHSRLDRHLNTLGILWIVIGALFMVPAVGLMIFRGSAHFILHDSETMGGLLPVLLTVASGTLVILAAGGVCLGLGLMQRRPWARGVGIVLGVLSLFHPPLGTALGVYTLWVLLADEHGNEYRYLSQAG